MRDKLYQLLGDLPSINQEISAKTISKEEKPGYLLEKLTLDLNGSEAVPAYFVKPKTKTAKKYPTVLFCHSHGGKYHWGKSELLEGNHYMHTPPYADELTSAGYAALCIDSPIFGERMLPNERTELDYFKETLWQGKVLWGMMVYDHLRAIDYLQSRDDVDTSRLATLGMSMGSTMSWWLAALDTRVKVCIDICCMTDFHTLVDVGGLAGHGIYYYVPGLLKHFDTVGINSLIAPRPHLSVNGALDALTPEAGMDLIDEKMKKVYAEKGRSDAWLLKKYPVQHEETAEMRDEIMSFLKKWL